jgi:ferredoxin
MIKIIHLRHKCIGCNACVEAAAEEWVISKNDGKAFLRKSTQKGQYFILEVDDWKYEENKLAADNCPVRIIKIQ